MINSLAIVPLTTALVSLVKGMDILHKKYMPLVGLFIGCVITWLVIIATEDTMNTGMIILQGIANGLSSVGLYEVGKNTGVNEKIGEIKDTIIK